MRKKSFLEGLKIKREEGLKLKERKEMSNGINFRGNRRDQDRIKNTVEGFVVKRSYSKQQGGKK